MVFNVHEGFIDQPVEIPCSRCIGCRIDKQRDWAVRCLHEASMYEDNSFITLTYSEENLPPGGSLQPRDFTTFMKRLRESVQPKQIRFFQCGEYGTHYERPHHHALLFNHRFDDAQLHGGSGPDKLYRSAELERLWPHGFSTIGEVTRKSANYVAAYVIKKLNGDWAEQYQGKHPEYATMSLRPGIGKPWFDRYWRDAYPSDYLVIDGLKTKPPAYYDKLYQREQEKEAKRLKRRRKAEQKDNPNAAPRVLIQRGDYREYVTTRTIRSYEK